VVLCECAQCCLPLYRGGQPVAARPTKAVVHTCKCLAEPIYYRTMLTVPGKSSPLYTVEMGVEVRGGGNLAVLHAWSRVRRAS